MTNLDNLETKIRDCCNTPEDSNHTVSCPHMLKLDASFTQDPARRVYSQTYRNATAIRNNVLKQSYLHILNINGHSR